MLKNATPGTSRQSFDEALSLATSDSPNKRAAGAIRLSTFWTEPSFERELSAQLASMLELPGSDNRFVRCRAAEAIGDAMPEPSSMHGGSEETRSERIAGMLYGSSKTWSIGSVTQRNIELKSASPDPIGSNDCVSELDATREAIRKAWRYLRRANLNDTDLARIRLYEADLEGASFLRANLGGATFECSNLAEAQFDDSNWTGIQTIRSANVHSATPTTFHDWAISRGAVDMTDDQWDTWRPHRAECND